MTLPAESSDVERDETPGRARPMLARWVITGTLTLETASSFGGIEGASTDLPVLRDPVSGRPLLPGTSLAGALRSHLADLLGGYRSPEDSRVATLFGGRPGDDQGAQSPLIVFDALGTLPADRTTEIRDGVKIETSSGTAEKHKKFDRELLPAGTRFELRFELVIADEEQEIEQLSLLAAALEGLEKAQIALGARRSRGLGKASAGGWQAMRHDLSSSEGWLGWLLSDPIKPIPAGPAGQQCSQEGDEASERVNIPTIRDALGSALPGEGGLTEYTDERQQCTIEVDLAFPLALLVRSPGDDPAAPDAVHLRSGGEPILPGTSVAGALRARAGKILRCLPKRRADAEVWVDRLFGPSLEGTTDPDFNPWASRLRVAESEFADHRDEQQTRVGIDRFTQGVVSGVFVEEQPVVGARTKLELELRDPEPGEIGLLILLLKDLLSGDLPLGGTSSVGRGVASGSATLTTADGRSMTFSPDATPEPETVSELDGWIKELLNASRLGQEKTEEGAAR